MWIFWKEESLQDPGFWQVTRHSHVLIELQLNTVWSQLCASIQWALWILCMSASFAIICLLYVFISLQLYALYLSWHWLFSVAVFCIISVYISISVWMYLLGESNPWKADEMWSTQANWICLIEFKPETSMDVNWFCFSFSFFEAHQ